MNKKVSLSIIQMNDIHGYMDEHWEYIWKGNNQEYKMVGGFARIASYINKVRKENDNKVLVLDGGDTFHGTYPVVKTKGEILIPLLNALGIDGMTAHWDFAYGPKHFSNILGKLNYPMLAINCYDSKSKDLVFQPYIIKKVDNLKIGIIGIAATIIDKTMPEHFSNGIFLTLGNKELPHYISKLKDEEDVDLVVVLSHLGYPQEVKLAQEVDGIDVLLSSHTHNRLYTPTIVKNTIIIQSGSHGSFLGHLDLIVKDKNVINYYHNLVLLDKEVPEDTEMKDMVMKSMEPYKEDLNKLVGHTKIGLSRDKVLETTMDNLLLEALLDYSGAEVAFSNGWRYGAPIPTGPITENDLWNMIPSNPPVSTVDITGEELWDMFEENLENTFSCDPYNQMGGYVKRALGVNIYFKIENHYGNRIQEFFVGNEPLDKDCVYKATFVTEQGIPKKYGTNRKDLDVKSIDALKAYMDKNKEVNPHIKNTIIAI